ncbi:MAG: hypothetical protein QS748_14565 [Candidatus Endonucleobacter bathymodioli]|uniref:Uncharacterized protein n=1 Tax=Candidatus Endonucleibacter bathymodioli TaxID=539814 RepID=A0AA90SEC0_9GAMM|nr:hypothetical protein [Candidatus Endonucleobacter bathymodioli]
MKKVISLAENIKTHLPLRPNHHHFTDYTDITNCNHGSKKSTIGWHQSFGKMPQFPLLECIDKKEL